MSFSCVLARVPHSLHSFNRPQYYEIYRHKEVIGISTTFMLIDCLGGVFSDLSLAFKDKFDVVAATTYSVVVVSSIFQKLFFSFTLPCAFLSPAFAFQFIREG